MIIDNITSKIGNLPMIKLDRNCYEFTDFYNEAYTTKQLIDSDIYIYFKDQIHKVKCFNDPYKVVLPIIEPYYVDQIMICDELLTDGIPIHLKFFLDECDWSCDRRQYFNILEYVNDSNERLYNDLFNQAQDNLYFSKVFIDESNNN